MRKLFAATALSALVMLGGCQNPDGSINAGNTLLLGAGVAAVTGLAVAANQPRHYGYGHRPVYHHGHGYGRPYRGW